MSAELDLTDVATVKANSNQVVELPLLDTLIAIREIEKTLKDADLCRGIQDYMLSNYRLALTMGEADNLRDKLEHAYAKKKQQRAEDMKSILVSLRSTDSAASG